MEIKPIEQGILPDRIMKKLSKEVIAQLERNQPDFELGQLATLQLVCKGQDKCPYKGRCPVQGNELLDESCPLELLYQRRWFNEYLDSFQVQQSDRQQASLINSLVATELQLMRQQQQLQHDGMEELVITESENGKKIERKLHSIYQLVENLENRKVKLLKSLTELYGGQSVNIVGDLSSLLSKFNKDGKQT